MRKVAKEMGTGPMRMHTGANVQVTAVISAAMDIRYTLLLPFIFIANTPFAVRDVTIHYTICTMRIMNTSDILMRLAAESQLTHGF